MDLDVQTAKPNNFFDPTKQQIFRDASAQIFSFILRRCHMHRKLCTPSLSQLVLWLIFTCTDHIHHWFEFTFEINGSPAPGEWVVGGGRGGADHLQELPKISLQPLLSSHMVDLCKQVEGCERSVGGDPAQVGTCLPALPSNHQGCILWLP